jgi:hypothetical protein
MQLYIDTEIIVKRYRIVCSILQVYDTLVKLCSVLAVGCKQTAAILHASVQLIQ